VAGLYCIEVIAVEKPTASCSDVKLASADARRFDGEFSNVHIRYNAKLLGKHRPKSGYVFQAMTTDEKGDPYAVDTDSSGAAVHNLGKFAYVATPAKYGSSGTYTFIIDQGAQEKLLAHIEKMKKKGKILYQAPTAPEQGYFVPPTLIEIPDMNTLTGEVFGPILHVIRYHANQLDDVIAQINSTGYGLTFGIHSRVDTTVDYLKARVHAGNVYVNRNMIGAVVGVQPFGGEGLSGTGPKAGGPYYLPRLAVERVVSVNTTASGGNASLMSLGQ
jgi:hypothetical protein